MTRRVELPSNDQVHTAIRDLSNANPVLTVRTLTQHLGLSNGTFWRYFPEIAQAVADQRRCALREGSNDVPAPAARKPDAEPARLRAKLEDLKSQVSVAAAEVQRLTLENQALRQQLEAESSIIRIPQNR